MSREQRAVQLPREMVQPARALVLQLGACLRTLRVHGPSNRAFEATLDKLADLVNALLPHGGGRLELRFLEDILLVNDSVLRVSAGTAPHFEALNRMLRERGVGGLAFGRDMDRDTLRAWFLRFEQPAETPEARLSVRRSLEELARHGVETLDEESLAGRQDLEVIKVSSFGYALQAYARAVVGFREFVSALKKDRDPFLGRLNIVRVVQDLVDVASSSGALLLRVLDHRDAQYPAFVAATGAYAPRHAASMTVYALLMGKLAELDRFQLLDLGTATLLSKVGFALLPESMTERRDQLSVEERRHVRLAMVRGVQALVARSRLSDIMMRRVIVAYEHQRPYAGPDGRVVDTHVYSRIVAVADAYDAMTTPRPWRGPLTREVALSNLRQGAGSRFDPALVSVMEALVNRRLRRG